MKIAISAIAWDPSEDNVIGGLLSALSVNAIELVPARVETRALFGDGFVFPSMQALLFGKPELQLFGDEFNRSALDSHLRSVIQAGVSAGCKAFVFGSPKNRIRGELPAEKAFDKAVTFFRKIGDFAHGLQSTVCIEANPTTYGADFITTLQEAANLVSDVNSPGFKLHLDTGELIINNQKDVFETVSGMAKLIGHVHISAPNLEPIYLSPSPIIKETIASLRSVNYPGYYAIEMKKVAPEKTVSHVRQAVQFVRSLYI